MTLVELNREKKDGAFRFDEECIHHYLPSYDKLFAPFRDKEINLFELGYYKGGSSRLWEKYFPKATIKCIDIDPACPPPTSDRITLELIDVRRITTDYFLNFRPDIAIDDGSHAVKDQIHFVKIVYPILKKGGLLIIEDIQNIESAMIDFNSLDIPFDVIDLRKDFGRYDDVLIVFRK